MKKVLETILLIATIGGGFSGVTLIFMEFIKLNNLPGAYYVVMGVALILNVYVLAAGLTFSNDRTKTKHLKRALLLQVPLISSPFIYYKFGAGVDWTVLFYRNGVNGYYNLGSTFQLATTPHYSWAIGVNIVALTLFLLTLKVYKSS